MQAEIDSDGAMEHRCSRHVSVGALVLAACALLAAVVGTVSVLASDLDDRSMRANSAHVLLVQDKLPDQVTVFAAYPAAITPISTVRTSPVE
jgi:hypothetical protein